MTEGQTAEVARARVDYENSLSELSKWSTLRIIGSSTIGKAAIVVPILGYLLLFNQGVVDYLKLHSTLCSNCTISWRLNFFYFGSFFVATGSVLFAFFCPPVIERHAYADEFFTSEKDYYDSEEHRAFLVGHILQARATTYIRPKYMYPPASEEAMMTLVKQSQLMGQHYFLQNRSRRWVRLIIFGCYATGAALISVPTIGTCYQILKGLMQGGT